MKKFIKFVIFSAIAAVIVLVTFKMMDEVAYNPDKDVKSALFKFYASSDKIDLEPIVGLIDKYVDDVERVNAIQDIVSEQVGEWVNYIGSKYLCDYENANACEVKKKDLNILREKVYIVGETVGEFGDRIISTSRYNEHLEDINEAIEAADKVLNSASSTSPKTALQLQKEKCERTNECENCNRNGMCSCVLRGVNGKKEVLECYKPHFAN